MDLNGDCLADLVLTTPTSTGVLSLRSPLFPIPRLFDLDCLICSIADTSPQYEVFLNIGNGYSQHSTVRSVPKGAGHLTFADFSIRVFNLISPRCESLIFLLIDGDGTIDVAFPVCNGINCALENSIHIIYNEQLPLCQCECSADLMPFTIGPLLTFYFVARSVFDSGCRKDSDQCAKDDGWNLPDFISPSGKVLLLAALMLYQLMLATLSSLIFSLLLFMAAFVRML